MNVIVSFDSMESRETFVAKVRSVEPTLAQRSYLGRHRPDAVFESLSDAEASRIRELARGLGRVFEDVKFDTFPSR
jgi:hypothetical protein